MSLSVSHTQMKIYKFRDLTDCRNDKYFLEILIEKLIWCPSPSTLNDDKEFNFELDYTRTSNTTLLLADIVKNYGRMVSNLLLPGKVASGVIKIKDEVLADITKPIISGMIENCKKDIGISSFSTVNDEPWLWEEYGGKGNGVCIEITIPDSSVGNIFHLVDYVPEKVFHVDLFMEAGLDSAKVHKLYRKMLLTKTTDWEKEKEIRFIGKENNMKFVIDGNISKIEFGNQVEPHRFEHYLKTIKDHCIKNDIEIIKHKNPG